MKIEILFPDAANLFGDLWNAKYLAEAAGAEIVETPLKGKPAFPGEDIALLYIGSMTESRQELAIEALLPYKEALISRIENGGLILATGNAMELFGKHIENEDGSVIPALGITNSYAARIRPKRRNSLYAGEYTGISGTIKIVGYNSRFSNSVISGEKPLFTTLRGIGSDEDNPGEGIRRNNLFATYLLGPLIILNPEFCRELLTLMGVLNPQLPHEEAVMAAFNARISEYMNPKTNMIYS